MKRFLDFKHWFDSLPQEEKEYYQKNRSAIKAYGQKENSDQFFVHSLQFYNDDELSQKVDAFIDALKQEVKDIVGNQQLEFTQEYNTILGQFASHFFAVNINGYPKVDPHKGILLIGSPGNGKTVLMKAYANLIARLEAKDEIPIDFIHKGRLQSYVPIMVSASEIISCFYQNGSQDLNRFHSIKELHFKVSRVDKGLVPPGPDTPYSIVDFQALNLSSTKTFPNKISYPVLCIDDLGYGTTSNSQREYGNVFNPICDIIKQRYDKKLITFGTTNITPNEIFDEPTMDRCREMFNMIFVNLNSFRK